MHIPLVLLSFVVLIVSSVVGSVGISASEFDELLAHGGASTEHFLREKRDGYGGGYGGGGYGCSCPYQSCDSGSDMLLYFAAGALLGLLFSMLQGTQMMMGGGGGRTLMGNQADPQESFLLSVPTILSREVAPLTVDFLSVYTSSQKQPECRRRWLCEVTQMTLKQGGLRAKLASLSSVAVSWLMKDMMPFLENLVGTTEDFLDCAILSPDCPDSFYTKSVTSSGRHKEAVATSNSEEETTV